MTAIKPEVDPMDTEPTPEEQQSIELLTGMMGDAVDAAIARRVLRKFNGNMEKAADAILSGERADDLIPGPRTPPPSRPEPPVIDLTADDDDKDGELKRALQASLQDENPLQLRPSDRAPDPNWAMVPSNVEAVSQDDQSLSRAIEASLNHSYNDFENETFDHLPLDQQVRKDNRPIALRPTQPTLQHAALLIQALFYVPQFREKLASYRVPGFDSDDNQEMFIHQRDMAVWTMVELYTYMVVAVLSELSVDDTLGMIGTSMATPTDEPGHLTCQLYAELTPILDDILCGDQPDQTSRRLFHFRYGAPDAVSNGDLSQKSIVSVNIGSGDQACDLMSCLLDQFSLPGASSMREVIYDSSDVIAFHIVRDQLPTYAASTGVASASSGRKLFKYPTHIYLDQYMKENVQLATEKREQLIKVTKEMQTLTNERSIVAGSNGKDNLADLRSTVLYYEKVAGRDDPERAAAVESIAVRVRECLTNVENGLAAIDNRIAMLQKQSAELFDCPELQRYRYDLRAVLVHDGQLGRKHLYSYVKHQNTWWKTIDYAVTEVSEDDVLNDTTGLHYGAGPYLLLYSRALSPEEETQPLPWPEHIKQRCLENNRKFLAQLNPEVTAQLVGSSAGTPSEYTFASNSVEPSSSRDEPMDTSA